MGDNVRVVDVDEAMRKMIMYMDTASIEVLLSQLSCDSSSRAILQDNQLWNELLIVHFGSLVPQELEVVPTKTRTWINPSIACASLRSFLRSMDDRDEFRQRVQIVRGDIGHIQAVNDMPVDGLAFPTNAYLSNNYIGAAAAIFKRAGRQLLDYVRAGPRHDVGEAVVTPAFNSGVKCLIHGVGPRVSQNDCYEKLALVYSNVMEAACIQGIQCLGLASISTGALGVPPNLGAPVALRAIQRFMRLNPKYRGRVGIVCYDESVLSTFESAHQQVLKAFNATEQ